MSAVLVLNSCGGIDKQRSGYSQYEDSEYEEPEYYEAESVSDSNALKFNNTADVYNYLDDKTFRGNGLSIWFTNFAHTVSINSDIWSNEVKVSDIGINEHNVAYATIQLLYPVNKSTTFILLAVKDHSQLIDTNDGSVYDY